MDDVDDIAINCWYCCRGFCPPKLFFGGLWPLDRRGMGGMGGMGRGTAEKNHGSTGSGLEGWRQEVHCQLQLKDFTWHLGWMLHGPWHVGLQWCSFPMLSVGLHDPWRIMGINCIQLNSIDVFWYYVITNNYLYLFMLMVSWPMFFCFRTCA